MYIQFSCCILYRTRLVQVKYSKKVSPVQPKIYMLSQEDIVTQKIPLTLGCTKATQISKEHFVFWQRLLKRVYIILKHLNKILGSKHPK